MCLKVRICAGRKFITNSRWDNRDTRCWDYAPIPFRFVEDYGISVHACVLTQLNSSREQQKHPGDHSAVKMGFLLSCLSHGLEGISDRSACVFRFRLVGNEQIMAWNAGKSLSQFRVACSHAMRDINNSDFSSVPVYLLVLIQSINATMLRGRNVPNILFTEKLLICL